MQVLSAPAGRVKASACAPPLARLAALTRPAAADLGLPSDLRFGMSMLLIDAAPRSFVAQHGVETALRMVNSLRATAMTATSFDLPELMSRSLKAFRTGL